MVSNLIMIKGVGDGNVVIGSCLLTRLPPPPLTRIICFNTDGEQHFGNLWDDEGGDLTMIVTKSEIGGGSTPIICKPKFRKRFGPETVFFLGRKLYSFLLSLSFAWLWCEWVRVVVLINGWSIVTFTSNYVLKEPFSLQSRYIFCLQIFKIQVSGLCWYSWSPLLENAPYASW